MLMVRRITLAASLCVVGLGAVSTRAGAAPSPPTKTVQVTSSNGLLSWHGLPDVEVADTTSGLYFSWVISPLGRAPVREELGRFNRSTGDLEAKHPIDGSVASVLSVGHVLFVTAFSHGGEYLLSFSPQSLHEIGDRRVADVNADFLGRGSMAIAGGSMWLAAGVHLDRFSETNAALQLSLVIHGAASSDVTSNASGTVLLVEEANEEGLGHLQQRDPLSGQLLTQSPSIGGIVDPLVDGVMGNDVWVSESTGNEGYTRLYDLDTLEPVGPFCAEGLSSPTCIDGTNGISAREANGDLWVTQPAGGPMRNFCATPDGRMLAAIPGSGDEPVLAIGSRYLYTLTNQVAKDKGETLIEVPLPSACRG
jgi:hypothetical protein